MLSQPLAIVQMGYFQERETFYNKKSKQFVDICLLLYAFEPLICLLNPLRPLKPPRCPMNRLSARLSERPLVFLLNRWLLPLDPINQLERIFRGENDRLDESKP